MSDDDFDTGRFARVFETFLHRFNEALPPASDELRGIVTRHLGQDPRAAHADRAVPCE